MPRPETLGLIGAGLLGTALATRLVRAGFSVHAFDPDPDSAARIAEIGGVPLPSALDVADGCRRILFSLPGPPEVRETVDILEPCLSAGAILVDTTTGSPLEVESHARRLATGGVCYLDAEIGGSSRQTAAGEAIVMCGGDSQAFESCRDILSAISDRVFHVGPSGSGTRMKLALNVAIGLHRAVLAESLSFAEKNGIDAARALEILKAGPAYSRAMDVKGAKMLSGDYAPDARLAQHLKDVRLIIETGHQVGARLPLSTIHEKLLAEAVQCGFGGEDNSAVFKLFSRAPE